jgi:hypothetical protein
MLFLFFYFYLKVKEKLSDGKKLRLIKMCLFFVDNLKEGFFQKYKNSLRKESITLNKKIGKW